MLTDERTSWEQKCDGRGRLRALGFMGAEPAEVVKKCLEKVALK